MRSSAARLLAFLFALVWLMSGCNRDREIGQVTAPPLLTGITVHTVSEEDLPLHLEVTGTVKAANAAVVAARIPATVGTVHVREGDRVSRGQLLLTLEAAEVRADAAGAAAGVEEARRELAEAGARAVLADATFHRFDRLYEEAAVTRQEFETRRMERDVAQQGLARAEARLSHVREQANKATSVAGHARVVAPTGGIITAKTAEAGMTVFPGMPLLTVEQEGQYRLELAVPESVAEKVRLGTRVRIAVDGAALAKEGTIAEVVPAVDPLTRTFTAKVGIPGAGVKSGMYGRADLEVGRMRAVTVPATSIFHRGNLTALWVVGKDHLARMRLVKPGKRHGERVEVLAGLAPGERVIGSGIEKVVDGAKLP